VAAPFAEDRRAQAQTLDQLVERARKVGAFRAEVAAEGVRADVMDSVPPRGPARPAAPSTPRLVNLVLARMSA